jgi:hypothetical protein
MPERMPIDNLDAFAVVSHPLAPEGTITAVEIEAFAKQLQGYRNSRVNALTQREISDKAGWSLSKTNRIEMGQIRPAPSDVLALMIYSGVTDPNEIDAMVTTARANRTAKIDKTYDPVLSTSYRRYLEHEAGATDLAVYDSTLVPDFLRTTAYTASVDRAFARLAPHKNTDLANLRSQLHRERAAYLLGPNGPGLRIILDELIFYRPIGNEDQPPEHRYDEVSTIIQGFKRLHNQDVLRPPFENRWLNPNITIQIIPPSTNLLPYGGYPFGIVSNQGQPTAVHTEWTGNETNWFADSPKPQEYQDEFDSLSSTIPAAEHTLAILDGIAAAVETGEWKGKGSVARQFM